MEFLSSPKIPKTQDVMKTDFCFPADEDPAEGEMEEEGRNLNLPEYSINHNVVLNY